MADGLRTQPENEPAGHDGAADGYRFGDALISVATGDPDCSRWLRELLTPWLSLAPASPTGPWVRVVESAERFAALSSAQLRAPTRPVPCFTLDSALIAYPGWTDPDGTTVVADAEYGCYYRVHADQVEIVARPGDRLTRVGLMRVVREMATLRALASPSTLDLYAAGFVHRGWAVLLVGPKGAGKTTLLAHVLGSERAALLANERLLVDCGSARAAGVPTVVPIGTRTEQRFPALGRGLPRRAALLHAGEIGLAEARAAASGPKLVISPAQFAGQLGAPTQASAAVGTIVFPEIAPSETVWSLHPLARDEGAARLAAGVYACRGGTRAPTVFQAAAGQTTGMAEQMALARRLAGSVPLVRCQLGPDAYRGHARAWLRALPLPKEEAIA